MSSAGNAETEPEMTTESGESRIVPYYVRASALGICAYFIGIHFWTWVFNVRYFLAGRADFRALYTAGYLVRTGYRHRLYEYGLQTQVQNAVAGLSDTPLPFNHLAYESLLFAPLSAFTYRTAYCIFLAVNVLVLTGCFAMLQPWMRNLQKVYRWFPLALFTAYLPIAAALIQGQDSILLLAAFCGVLALVTVKKQEGLSGLLLGMTVFKFQFALPVVTLFFLWRRWKFVTGFMVSAAVSVLVSIWLVGWSQTRIFVNLLSAVGATSRPSDYLGAAVNPAHMPNLRGLIFGLGDNHLPLHTLQMITAVLSLILLLRAATIRNVAGQPAATLIAITAAVLVSYHSNIHDLAILLVPVLCTLNQYLLDESCSRTSRWLTLSATLVFCAPIAESFFPDHLYLAAIPTIIFFGVLAKYGLRAGEITAVPAGSQTARSYSPVL